MAEVFSFLKGAGATASNVFLKAMIWFGVILVVGLIVLMIVISIRNKKVYCQPVRLLRILENGTKKEMNGLRGGKVRRKGVFTFEVKIPWKFKKHDLGYMPDMTRTDADNRLVFISVGDGTLWQQCYEEIKQTERVTIELTQEQIESQRKAFVEYIELDEQFKSKTRKEKEKLVHDTMKEWFEKNQKRVMEYNLIMTPIKTEVKTATLNSLKSWQEVLDRNKIKVFTIAIGAFIIMVIAHLISLYIQTKIKCPTGIS